MLTFNRGEIVADKEQAKRRGAHGGFREGAGGRPVGEHARIATVPIRCSEEWKAAVSELAAWDRAASLADLFDRAIVSYARERGYKVQIPKR